MSGGVRGSRASGARAIGGGSMACAHPDAVDDVLRDRRKPSQGGSASAPPRGIEPRAPTAFLPKGWPSRRELRASRRESEGARPCCGSGKVAEIDKVRDLCERATRGDQAGLTRACEEEAWLPVPGGGASNSAPQRRDPVASSVVDENGTSISARHSLIGSAANENMSWHMPSTCPGTRRCAADGRLKQVVAVASI